MYPNGARGRSCEQELACFRARYYDLKSMSVTALSPYREPVTAAAVAAVRHVSWNLTVTQQCHRFNEPGPAYSMPTMPALANVEDVMVEHLRIISSPTPTTQTSRGSRSQRLELARQAKELALAALAAAEKAAEDAAASTSDEDDSDNTAEAAQAIITMYEVEEQQEQQEEKRDEKDREQKEGGQGGQKDEQGGEEEQMASVPSVPSLMDKEQLINFLVHATPAQARQSLGDRLYVLIHVEQELLAGKITGMILEGFVNQELVALVFDKAALQTVTQKALAALEAQAQSRPDLVPSLFHQVHLTSAWQSFICIQCCPFVCSMTLI